MGTQRQILLISSILALVVTLITLGSFLAVLFRSDFDFTTRNDDFKVIKFTIWQAFLSALISTFLAIPVARAFSRRNFFLKNMLISFLGAPFILPVIIAVIAFIMIFGQSGLINKLLTALDLPKLSIYGVHGIVVVNSFFNFPLAIRLIFNGWTSIPAERFRLSAQLNLSSWGFFRLVELPMLKTVLPGIFMIVFIICLSSFVVALSLGGGPKSTTIELAIYQSFRFDFDLGRACTLALIQFVICSLTVILSMKFLVPKPFSPTLGTVVQRWDIFNFRSKFIDFTVILITLVFISLPILAIFVTGAAQLPKVSIQVWEASVRSLTMALCSSLAATSIAFSLAYAAVKINSMVRHLYEFVGYISISLSPLLLGTGLFILILPVANPNQLAIPIIVIVNALMAIPFILRILLPPLREVVDDFGKLSQNIGLSEWYFIKLVIFPRLSRPIGFSIGLAAAISIGDFGVVALFSLSDNATLPMTLFSLMGAYRLTDAAAAAVILLLLSFGLFILSDWGGKYFARST